jgi:phospholipid/cholesterol/gamma-HCH transport system substrate-binding protein
MMKSRTYIRVAILFLATAVIVFWGLNYLKGKNLLTAERSFYSLYDRIGGLTKSSPVTINGFQVGQVRRIDLSERLSGKIEVRFSISYRSINIPKGSSARIYSVDLMGTKGIALDLADNPELCNSNDTLAGSIEGDLWDQVNAQMFPLKVKIESLMSSMDSVLSGIQLVFNESNIENLAESFTSVKHTLTNLESASGFLDQYLKKESGSVTSLLTGIDTLSKGLLERTHELKRVVGNMNRITDTLASVPLNQTIASFRDVLGNLNLITQKISAGEGSIGKLIINDSLYTAILATNSSLNRLIEDIRIHPGRYVRVTLSDKSKAIYTADDSELARALAGQGTSDYYVCIFQTPAPLPPDNPALLVYRNTDFIQVGSQYYYFVYKNRSIEPCLRKLDNIRRQTPAAGIYTWVNGQWRKLDI